MVLYNNKGDLLNLQRQGTIADVPEDNAVDSSEISQKQSPGSMVGKAREAEEKTCDDVSGNISSRKNKFQKETADTGAGGAVGLQSLDPMDSKVSRTSTSQISGASEFNIMTQSSSLPDDQKLQPVGMVSDGISSGNRDRATELKRELVVSEDILETKPGSGLFQEPSKPCRPIPHTVSGNGRRKMVVCIGKTSSCSATEKSSRCDDNPKPSTSRNSIPGSKQQSGDDDADANANDEDCVSSDVIRERDGDDEPSEKALKHPKFPITSTKSMQHNRTSHSSVSKTRESSSSSKTSSAARLNGGSFEAPNKHSLSGTFPKNEKPGQSIFQSSTKNPVQSIISLAPNLSDEEVCKIEFFLFLIRLPYSSTV